MFKDSRIKNEFIKDTSKSIEKKGEESKIFTSWREKNLHVAEKLAEVNYKEISDFFDNFIDERGDFKKFIINDNIKYFTQFIQSATPASTVTTEMNQNYSFVDASEGLYDATPDFDDILIKAFSLVLAQRISRGYHKNNLSIITAAIQCYEHTSDGYSGSGNRNAADLQFIFKKSLNQADISVLEKLYINYLGGQFNQSESEYFDDILKETDNVAYQKFIADQPDIQKFQKREINIKNLLLPYISRRAILRDMTGDTPLSFTARNEKTDIETELTLMSKRQRFNILGKEKFEFYDKILFDQLYVKRPEELLQDFFKSPEGCLRPCFDKIHPLQRIDADGEYIIADLSPEYYGVYSVSGNLEAFFEKDKVMNSSTDEPVNAHDFAEIKKYISFRDDQDLAGFKLMSSLFFREKLKEICGADIGHLNLRAQYQFLDFISQYSEAELSKLNDFLDNSISDNGRIDRLKSFLCLELDKKLGEKMIVLGKKFSPVQADILFAKIAEINDLACKEESELGVLLMKDHKDFNLSGLKPELLKRAQALVLKFSQVKSDKFQQVETTQILSELENIKTEMVLFSSLLKTAKENKQNINLDTIRGLDLKVKDYGEKINTKDEQEILAIARTNWHSFGNLKMAEVVTAGLVEALTDSEQQRAYILKYENEVIGFVRFEKTDKGTVYAGSFNVSRDLRGLSIGNELMEKALIKEGEIHTLEATASIKIPAGCSYVEKIGFVADGLITDYHQTGESLFSIKLDQVNNSYKLRNKDKRHTINEEDIVRRASDYHDLDQLIGQESIILRFNLNSEMKEYEEALACLLPKIDDNGNKIEAAKDKYTLTRYFYDKKEDPAGNIRYLAFERNH